jgi:hypothetical protein
LVPRTVIGWLDHCYPQDVKKKNGESAWLGLSVTAIIKQQQMNSFDCGVACLLYAEKCGQGQFRQDIDEWTDQFEISAFRTHLLECVQGLKAGFVGLDGSDPPPSPSNQEK